MPLFSAGDLGLVSLWPVLSFVILLLAGDFSCFHYMLDYWQQAGMWSSDDHSCLQIGDHLMPIHTVQEDIHQLAPIQMVRLSAEQPLAFPVAAASHKVSQTSPSSYTTLHCLFHLRHTAYHGITQQKLRFPNIVSSAQPICGLQRHMIIPRTW